MVLSYSLIFGSLAVIFALDITKTVIDAIEEFILLPLYLFAYRWLDRNPLFEWNINDSKRSSRKMVTSMLFSVGYVFLVVFELIIDSLAKKRCRRKVSITCFITCILSCITTEATLQSIGVGYVLGEILISLFSLISTLDPSTVHNMSFPFFQISQRKIKRYISHRVNPGKIKPGDHIYSWRHGFVYAHHGVYIGGGFVIHYTSRENHRDLCLEHSLCGYQQRGSGVALCCVNCFIGSGSLYLFKYEASPFAHIFKLRGGTSTTAKSDPPHKVVHRAMNLVQNGFGRYHVSGNNCEDFSLYCKTGLACREQLFTGSSGQVSSWVGALWMVALSLILKGSFWEAAFVATVVHCLTRYTTDVGVRDDMVKVEDVSELY